MTASPVTESPKSNPISRPLLGVLVFAVTLGIGGLTRWVDAGPERPGFWPFIVLLAIGLGVFTYYRPIPYLSYNQKPPETQSTALMWAIVWGVVEAGIFWGLYYFAWSENRYWTIALMMGVLGGTNRYFHGRHLRKRHRAQIMFAIILVLIFIGAKYATRH